MADFGEPFELCKIFQKGSLLGIRKHSDDNHVILTFKDRGVQVYNLDNQKLVNSWSVERHQDVTCPAIQDPTTKNFVTVIKKMEICVWTSSSSNLQHSKKCLLEKPVQDICVNMEANLEPAVVFEDGSVAKLSECMQFNSGQPKNKRTKKVKTSVKSNSLLWYNMCRQNNKTFVFLLYCEASKHHRLDILSLENEEGKRLVASCRLHPPEKDARIVACTMEKTRPDLVTFWSDGSLSISDLCSVLLGCGNGGNTSHEDISCIILQKLSSLASSCNKGCVSIATVDSSNICVCGSSLVNKNQEDTVSIWSTKYGTLQGKQSINKLRDVSSSSAILRQSPGVEHVCCTAGYVCVGVPYGVGVCPVSVQGSSLANSLGRLSAASQFSSERNVKPSLLITPKLARPGQELREWCKTIKSEDSAEEHALKKLTTPKKTPSLEIFSSELQHYINDKAAKEKAELHDDATESGKRSSVEKPAKCLFSQHFVTNVLRRCLTENQFWPRDSLDLLIQTRSIPASESTELLKVLIDKDEMELMVKCFKNIIGIPETATVSCLQYVLSFDGEQVSKDDPSSEPMELDTDGDTLTHKQCPVAPTREDDLCTILSYPFNDVFMQDSLRQLPFQNALSLLKFLHYLMTQNSKLLTAKRRKGDLKLTYSQVLDWASLLLNAHYTQLVLMPEAHEMLVSFHQVVEEQVQVFNSIQKLEGFLAQYKDHQPLPKKEHVGAYTVEMLEL